MMKKPLFVLVLTAGLFTGGEAQARRIRIPVNNDIPKVIDLPDSTYYRTDEGEHLDLGYIEEEGVRTLVLFAQSNADTYYDIPDDYVELLQRDLGVEDLRTLITDPSFWDRWGGRILFYGFGALIVIGIISYLKDFIGGIFRSFRNSDQQ